MSWCSCSLLPVTAGPTSAADLKFLHHLQQALIGTSNRKAALETIELLVPLCFRSSCQNVLRCITNFGNGALAGHEPHPIKCRFGQQDDISRDISGIGMSIARHPIST